MKGTEHFNQTIKAFLDKKAASDELFAQNYSKPDKNLDDCITYVLNWVQVSGCVGFSDDEIYGQCIHYFDEDHIDIGKPIQCKVVVNHHIELTDAEKAEARQKAIRQYQEEEIQKMRNRKKAKPAPPQTNVTPSLFDF
mgnify:FL=1